jgi:hypothetical protein
MKKFLIHAFQITKPSEKVQLQIPIPRNANRIVALKVTASGISPSVQTSEVGWLWLRIPEKRDVFFAEIVRTPIQDFGRQTYAPINALTFGTGQGWIDGTAEHDFSIDIEAESTLFEGYYTDQLKGNFRTPYTVKIYLTLEL